LSLRKMASRLLLLFATFVGLGQGVPQGFHNDIVLEKLLADDNTIAVEVPAVPFHFRYPLLKTSDFADLQLSLIDLSETMNMRSRTEPDAAAPEEKKDEDPPIVCETICRPQEESDLEERASDAKVQNAKSETPSTRPPEPAKGGEPEMDTKPTEFISMAELGRTICESKGGGWVDDSGKCDPFMRSTELALEHDGEGIFNACKLEHGDKYVPCSPYQALALAHMYNVPDHSYYWLWPGGRHDQVDHAVMKQDFGHNPASGMDKCPADQYLGFFHNWNEAHVDSWGCLHASQKIPVLCCRQN